MVVYQGQTDALMHHTGHFFAATPTSVSAPYHCWSHSSHLSRSISSGHSPHRYRLKLLLLYFLLQRLLLLFHCRVIDRFHLLYRCYVWLSRCLCVDTLSALSAAK